MASIIEKRRQTPVIEEADVVVVGGGSAGFPAAIAAARLGARTVLIEKWGYAGGAAVGGLVLTVPPKAGIWGVEKEMYDRLRARGAIHEDPPNKEYYETIVSAPECKILGDAMLQEAGVVILYHSLFVGVAAKDGRIDAVIIENKSGRQAVRAKVVIDTTGDGDVAARAGVPFTLGNAEGKMLEATTMYLASDVNAEQYLKYRVPTKDLPGPVSGLAFTKLHRGEINCWGGKVEGDATDVRELTRMEIALRAQIRTEWDNMRRYHKGFETAYITCLAEQMGMRETRHVHADYMVTQADEKAKTRFPDSIGVCWEFTVPYRALCAQTCSNLLLGGRCIGAESAAIGPLRIVPNCCTTGQAAGAAAALAAAKKGDVRAVEIGKLQETLKGQGVELGV